MGRSYDFATLDLRDALDLATLIEEEARERYEELAQQMETHHTEDTARFFRFMVENETKHGTELAARRQALFPAEPRRVDRSMLWDEEAPSYDEVRVFLTPREAMKVALAAERKAQAFFAGALPHVKDESVAALFEELRKEEVEHEAYVRRELEALGDEVESSAEETADEPVAQ